MKKSDCSGSVRDSSTQRSCRCRPSPIRSQPSGRGRSVVPRAAPGGPCAAGGGSRRIEWRARCGRLRRPGAVAGDRGDGCLLHRDTRSVRRGPRDRGVVRRTPPRHPSPPSSSRSVAASCSPPSTRPRTRKLQQAFQAQVAPTVAAVVGGRPLSLYEGEMPADEARRVLEQVLAVAAQNQVTGVATVEAPSDEPAEPVGATPSAAPGGLRRHRSGRLHRCDRRVPHRHRAGSA